MWFTDKRGWNRMGLDGLHDEQGNLCNPWILLSSATLRPSAAPRELFTAGLSALPPCPPYPPRPLRDSIRRMHRVAHATVVVSFWMPRSSVSWA